MAAKPPTKDLPVVLIATEGAQDMLRDEIRHGPAQRIAEVARSAEMDAAEDASVRDF